MQKYTWSHYDEISGITVDEENRYIYENTKKRIDWTVTYKERTKKLNFKDCNKPVLKLICKNKDNDL